MGKSKAVGNILETIQTAIRGKAKDAGQSVKTFRQKNPNDKDVKRLYAEKPKIKESDELRANQRLIQQARDKKNVLENKYYDEAEKKFEQEGKKFRQDYYAEDLDDYVDNMLEENHKIIADAASGNKEALKRFGSKDYRKGGMVLSTIDNRKKK
tara:strand:- start:25 stop:486 length:462 start_codon:yes stop_codon:yes gene_type:complete